MDFMNLKSRRLDFMDRAKSGFMRIVRFFPRKLRGWRGIFYYIRGANTCS